MPVPRSPVLALLVLAAAGCARDDGGPGHSRLDFPEGFLWGTATAAHQVEGGNENNDWWAWEQTPGHIANGDVSGEAADHYDRYEADFDLAVAGGHGAHRFSIEWSRVEPERDVWDESEIAHYDAVLDALEARGLVPVVTLSHFTSPLWVSNPLVQTSDLDGWLSTDTREEFAEFAGRMAQEYGDRVDLWVTFNEPLVSTVAAANDTFPPGAFAETIEENVAVAAQWAIGMIFAHGSAANAIRLADSGDADGDGNPAEIGIAQHMVAFAPAEPDDAHAAAAAWLHQIFNLLFVDAVVYGNLDVNLDGDHDDAGTSPPEGNYPQLAGSVDWIGLNYYRRMEAIPVTNLGPVQGFPQDDSDLPANELGWSIYPEGMLESLRALDAYGLPILITENGIPDGDDDERASYLVDHLVALHRAIEEGIPVTGYLHWSLIDNFEWAEGFEPRFGLVEVDYETQARIPRPSYDLFTEICTENALTARAQDRHRTLE